MKEATFDRVFRSSGVLFAVLFVVSYVIRGAQPDNGTSTETLASFYGDDRGRVLIGTFLLGSGAPDGAYARLILPIIALVWIAILSAVLTSRAPSPVRIPESAVATPAPAP